MFFQQGITVGFSETSVNITENSREVCVCVEVLEFGSLNNTVSAIFFTTNETAQGIRNGILPYKKYRMCIIFM